LPLLFYGIDETIALHRDWWHIVTTTTGETLLDNRNVSLAATFTIISAGFLPDYISVILGLMVFVLMLMSYVLRS